MIYQYRMTTVCSVLLLLSCSSSNRTMSSTTTCSAFTHLRTPVPQGGSQQGREVYLVLKHKIQLEVK